MTGGALVGHPSARASATDDAVVALIKTTERPRGIARLLEMMPPNGLRGAHVVIKPNLNSADPFPGSTHVDTLRALVTETANRGAARITVADRSGMGVTRRVMDAKGVLALGREMGFRTVVLNDLPATGWLSEPLGDGHWLRGILFPRLIREADAILQTCCLKTHRFGGHVTLSLKNSVGMVARYHPSSRYDYMDELHSSPHQRAMIAELNLLYRPALVVMDGIEAFVDGGPERGKKAAPGLLLAAVDRVALDAVGIAILRLLGTNRTVASGRIFASDQIRRAVEVRLGVTSADRVRIVTPPGDTESADVADRIRTVLARG